MTVTFQAEDTSADAAAFVIRVFPYNAPASAAVSIEEVGTDGSATSIVEE